MVAYFQKKAEITNIVKPRLIQSRNVIDTTMLLPASFPAAISNKS